jgi:hypothetical protein
LHPYTAGILYAVLALSAVSDGSLQLAPPSQAEVLCRQAPAVNPEALRMALEALDNAEAAGTAVRTDVLALIDYSRPSTEPRLWVFDLENNLLLFEELVAHGKNSGGDTPVRFSNRPGSLMSSLGVFVTANTYYGKHGYSLRLKGLEEGVNDNSMERAIVMHAASYVDPEVARRLGRLGRSWGCPAVRPEVSRQLIDAVKDGALLFAYYPDDRWLSTSRFLIAASGD